MLTENYSWPLGERAQGIPVVVLGFNRGIWSLEADVLRFRESIYQALLSNHDAAGRELRSKADIIGLAFRYSFRQPVILGPE
jgi:hypothetical protein